MKKISLIASLALLGTVLYLAVFPGSSTARVFRVFGPEDFVCSRKGFARQVRQFPVQYPGASDFTLHIFCGGERSHYGRTVPSVLVKVNGRRVVRRHELNRYVRYIKKPITLVEGNRLSVELRGKPGSGIRMVITGQNEEPQSFNFSEPVQPDGSNLFGPGLTYLWTIINKPLGANAWLSDPNSSSPDLTVDTTGEYSLELRVHGDSWEGKPIPIGLTATGGAMATPYSPFVPVPVETRVVTGVGDRYQDYSIKIGSDTYTAPAPASCGSPSNSGFQVLVLDRTTLAKRDHQSFNVPCGREAMVNFLSSNNPIMNDNNMVIVSSLYTAEPYNVCGMVSSLCPLLRDFGGTSVLSSSTPGSFTLPDGTSVRFSYSLIGIPHLGIFEGIELNNWDHKAFRIGDPMIYSNIVGYFIEDVNVPHRYTFAYPEYVEIETRAATSAASNTVKFGGDTCNASVRTGAAGGFQVVVLDRDTLQPIQSCSAFSTNFGSGVGSVSESEQKRMYDFLNALLHGDPNQQYVVVVASIGSPISYKSTYFTDLIKLVGNYFGGTIGVLNQLGPTSTYSLVGMTKPGFAAFPLGAADTVEASSPGVNLRAVMHKDKQGWFKPVVTATGDAGAMGGPDFSLLSVALQEPTLWPMTDPSDPMYDQYDAAYRYISSHLGAMTCPPENPGCAMDIRSRYTENPISPTQWIYVCGDMAYPANPTPYFSEDAFKAMKLQLCGGYDQYGNYLSGEFNYVDLVKNFVSDLDNLLIYMQLSETPSLLNVFNAVKAEVAVPDQKEVLYDAGVIIRGLLTAGTSMVTNPLVKATMGVLNGALSIGMSLSKTPEGADNTAVTAAALNLVNEMDNLWKNCSIGKEILFGAIKSDWGKLQYVGRKLQGDWSYSDLDKKDWETIIRNSLQAHYFKSLIPAVWKIDYVLDTTTIPYPKNFTYYADRNNYRYTCKPYCGGSTSNASAYWVDQFGNGAYSWYLFEDEIEQSNPNSTPCGYVHFDRSANLRDVLFGNGAWLDSAGNKIGEKLNLSKPLFYERWLPDATYARPMDRVPTATTVQVSGGYNGTCND